MLLHGLPAGKGGRHDLRSMDDYAAACVAELKKGTMTYSVSENNDYASRSIEDTVADVRVTQLEQADSLGNLSPDARCWSCGTSSMR